MAKSSRKLLAQIYFYCRGPQQDGSHSPAPAHAAAAPGGDGVLLPGGGAEPRLYALSLTFHHLVRYKMRQCCGSGSILDTYSGTLWIRIYTGKSCFPLKHILIFFSIKIYNTVTLDLDPDPNSKCIWIHNTGPR